MKIRNKSRNIDISDVLIRKSDYGTDVLIIINNNVYKFNLSGVYIDNVFDKIDLYLKEFVYEK